MAKTCTRDGCARWRARTERFLDDLVQTTVRVTGDQGWKTVLVSGGDRWTDQLASEFPDHRRDRVTPEPHLTERLVEQALAAGARVTPMEGAAQGMLQESDGVAALLRWKVSVGVAPARRGVDPRRPPASHR